MYKCEECNLEFNTFQEKANHHRWKHLKYMYKDDDSYKVSKEKKESNWGVFIVKCHKCDKEIEIKEYNVDKPKKDKYYCSRTCANSHHRTEESKLKISNTIKKKIENGEKVGFINNVDFKYKLQKPIVSICTNCNSEFSRNKKQKFCSVKCVNEYKTEYCRKNKTELQIYKKNCRFNFALNDYPDEFEFDLIKKYGWYQAKNHGDNLGGISRDHMFSVNEGFKMNVDPNLIKHPANCKLMIHNENISKNFRCSISIKELEKRIEDWNKKYNK